MQAYKICLIGDAQVGKTTWMNRLLKPTQDPIFSKFEWEEGTYKPTLGVEVHPFRYNFKIYNIWDTAGDERFKGLGQGYYQQCDYFFVFFDFSDPNNEKSIQKWIKNIPSLKIILIGIQKSEAKYVPTTKFPIIDATTNLISPISSIN